MTDSHFLNLYGSVSDSIVDGPGLRYSVFVQGCTHNCPGCHNPESQPKTGGTVTAIEDILADIRANKLISGVTLSGGEPFEQAEACAELASQLKAEGYSVWAYTGYLYEDLLGSEDAAVAKLLDNIDVLVDGPFVEAKKSLTLEWKGSSNQRVIDIPATREAGKVVEWKARELTFDKPPAW